MKGTRTVLRREGGSNPSDLADSLIGETIYFVDLSHHMVYVQQPFKRGGRTFEGLRTSIIRRNLKDYR